MKFSIRDIVCHPDSRDTLKIKKITADEDVLVFSAVSVFGWRYPFYVDKSRIRKATKDEIKVGINAEF